MIDAFVGKNSFLSNFEKYSIEYEGIVYPSVEHAFQAAKTLDVNVRKSIASVDSPSKAKQMGRNVTLRPDWNNLRIRIMYRLLLIKFQDPEMRAKLLNTGDEELVEGNYWNDYFWGVCNGYGENNLGKLLMRIRGEIRRKENE